MTQLLIVGTVILATGPLVDDGDSIECPGITYPKSVIVGYEIQDVSLPNDFTITTYEWVGNALHKIVIPLPPVVRPDNHANYIAMMESRADALEAQGLIVDAILLRESLK